MKRIFLLLTLLCLSLFTFVACDREEEPGEQEDNRPVFTITFDLGLNKEVVKVKEGELPTPPTVPDDDYGNFYKHLKGWTPEIAPATADATYKAVYENIQKQYT
ncbi:MAG: hypothetical protein IKC72_02435, partial [Clostridia bacterium]|nr:hypothetical protein [Clostridia bacterium]